MFVLVGDPRPQPAHSRTALEEQQPWQVLGFPARGDDFPCVRLDALTAGSVLVERYAEGVIGDHGAGLAVDGRDVLLGMSAGCRCMGGVGRGP